jgi:Fuc2NAc and GlcNAc transferase
VIVSATIAAVAALGVAAAVSWLIARNASRMGLVDLPNARSSHQSPTPRGGGMGIVAGVLVGVLLLAAVGLPLTRDWGVVIAGYLAIAALGALDDFRSIPARYRLLVQAIVALAVVTIVGSVDRLPLPQPLDLPLGLLATPLTVFWLLTVTNFFNFMDGLDGLAGGQSVASCAGIALAGWSLASREIAIFLAAASAGFLLFNFPRARLFLGDVGSTSLGFLIASLPLLAPPAVRPMALFAVALGLSLFLIDPLETLFRLVRTGQRLGVAHRAHSYQQLANRPEQHNVVAIAVVACGFALSIGGALALKMTWLAWPLVALGLGVYFVERFLASRSRGSVDQSAEVGA